MLLILYFTGKAARCGPEPGVTRAVSQFIKVYIIACVCVCVCVQAVRVIDS